MMALPATMVARLSKKREIRQEMSPVVGFRFFMNAPPQEALKLAGFCQSLTYAGITAITCLADGRRPWYTLQGGFGRPAGAPCWCLLQKYKKLQHANTELTLSLAKFVCVALRAGRDETFYLSKQSCNLL